LKNAVGETKLKSEIRSPPRGSETILLVEDEDAVRALTRLVLTNCGYSVLDAANGEEAVRLASELNRRIDLLITDVVMPGAGGRVVAERIAELHPGARVLFLSGYTDDAVVRHGILHEKVNFQQKPFSPVALALKVREVLDAPI
jgi:CheY-like chemotaxis protein